MSFFSFWSEPVQEESHPNEQPAPDSSTENSSADNSYTSSIFGFASSALSKVKESSSALRQGISDFAQSLAEETKDLSIESLLPQDEPSDKSKADGENPQVERVSDDLSFLDISGAGVGTTMAARPPVAPAPAQQPAPAPSSPSQPPVSPSPQKQSSDEKSEDEDILEQVEETLSHTITDIQQQLGTIGNALSGVSDKIWQNTWNLFGIQLSDDVDPSSPLPHQGGTPVIPARLHALIVNMEANPSSYTQEPRNKEDFEKFSENFDFTALEVLRKARSILDTNDTVRSFYNTLVPDEVEAEVFWCRYFYRICELQQEEMQRQSLLSAHLNTVPAEEEPLSWDDVDDQAPAPLPALASPASRAPVSPVPVSPASPAPASPAPALAAPVPVSPAALPTLETDVSASISSVPSPAPTEEDWVDLDASASRSPSPAIQPPQQEEKKDNAEEKAFTPAQPLASHPNPPKPQDGGDDWSAWE
eukprot:TRINITY_DN10810_c0_g1_i1.p1 TRINITY_DN10810_c0_g1~~TRINITY_DN10810_c0_g1_i1.p1  ORF type:complete len:476 (-),score=151.44 TRINITY_DN10810_c0_g1_i1:77-1504(-)